MSRERVTNIHKNACYQLWKEASFYLPSHQDLLGNLGDPAILGYQEGPEITHRDTHALSILYPKLLLTSIPTAASQVIYLPNKSSNASKRNKPQNKIPPQLLYFTHTRTHGEIYTHSWKNTHFDCVYHVKLYWRSGWCSFHGDIFPLFSCSPSVESKQECGRMWYSLLGQGLLGVLL